jgi:hypothetical protein
VVENAMIADSGAPRHPQVDDRGNGIYEYDNRPEREQKVVGALITGEAVALSGLLVPQLRLLNDSARFVGFESSGTLHAMLVERAEMVGRDPEPEME